MSLNVVGYESPGVLKQLSSGELDSLFDNILDHYINSGTAYAGTLNINGTGNSIGTYEDTRLAGNVGESNITIISTSFELKQVETAYYDLTYSTPLSSNSSPNFLGLDTTASTVTLQANISTLSQLADNVIARISANSVGSYFLSENSPSDGGTWQSVGTLTDLIDNSGNPITTYTLWKKIGPISSHLYPTKIGDDSVIQQFSEDELNKAVAYVEQRFLETRIGEYRLQSTAPATGTWINVGTVQDVRSNVISTSFTGLNYEATYDNTYDGQVFSTNYDTGFDGGAFNDTYLSDFDGGSFSSNYDGVFESAAFTASFSNVFESNFTGTFSSNFVGNFTSPAYVGTFTGIYQGVQPTTFQRNFISAGYAPVYFIGYGGGGSYARNYLQTFGAYSYTTFTGYFEGGGLAYYTRAVLFIGYYTGPFPGTIPVNFTTNVNKYFSSVFSGTYTGDFSSTYTGTYDSVFTSSYTGTYDATFAGNYIASYEGQFEGSYTSTYEGAFIGNYEGSYDTSYLADYEATYDVSEVGSGTETITTITLWKRIA